MNDFAFARRTCDPVCPELRKRWAMKKNEWTNGHYFTIIDLINPEKLHKEDYYGIIKNSHPLHAEVGAVTF